MTKCNDVIYINSIHRLRYILLVKGQIKYVEKLCASYILGRREYLYKIKWLIGGKITHHMPLRT